MTIKNADGRLAACISHGGVKKGVDRVLGITDKLLLKNYHFIRSFRNLVPTKIIRLVSGVTVKLIVAN